jgi:3-oxoacyl-[acyl-carrier protein] reductase
MLALLEGAGHRIFPFDLTQSDDIAPWLKSVTAGVGPLSGLVHAAGIHGVAAVRGITSRGIEDFMRTNVSSALLLVKGLCQRGCRAEETSVVFLSSVSAIGGAPGLSIYSSTKAALLSMTKSLAAELARKPHPC